MVKILKISTEITRLGKPDKFNGFLVPRKLPGLAAIIRWR